MPLPLKPPSITQVPRHTRGKPQSSKPPTHRSWLGLEEEDLEGLAQIIQECFQWEHLPREFQVQAIRAQLLQKDVLIHAGTGSGKMAIAAGPHTHPKAKGMVTFMVSPLIVLQEEQVK
jgi:superfamily II DNA helicase RecQ